MRLEVKCFNPPQQFKLKLVHGKVCMWDHIHTHKDSYTKKAYDDRKRDLICKFPPSRPLETSLGRLRCPDGQITGSQRGLIIRSEGLACGGLGSSHVLLRWEEVSDAKLSISQLLRN